MTDHYIYIANVETLSHLRRIFLNCTTYIQFTTFTLDLSNSGYGLGSILLHTHVKRSANTSDCGKSRWLCTFNCLCLVVFHAGSFAVVLFSALLILASSRLSPTTLCAFVVITGHIYTLPPIECMRQSSPLSGIKSTQEQASKRPLYMLQCGLPIK